MPAKDAAGMAKNQAGMANQYAGTDAGRATGTYNAMFPELQKQATDPTGFTPTQLGGMNTANQQGAGGGVASVTGQAGLMAGRTRNPGSMQAGLAEATRESGRNEAQRALGIQEANANMAMNKQQHALGELGNLYGQNQAGLSNMMGAANTANKQYADASKSAMDYAQQGVGMLKDLSETGMNAMGMAKMA